MSTNDEIGDEVGTRLLFENERVRVWDLRLAPGERTGLHRHTDDYLYVVPGNRDDRALLREAFVSAPCFASPGGLLQYAVDDHPVRLLALDTLSDRSNKGHYCAERLAALERTLAEQPGTPTAIVAHHPPFDVPGAGPPLQFESREAAALLTGALVGAKQVIRLFCGHAHRAAEVDIGGIRASTPPSLAEDLRKGEDPALPGSVARFQVHRFAPGRGFTTDGFGSRLCQESICHRIGGGTLPLT